MLTIFIPSRNHINATIFFCLSSLLEWTRSTFATLLLFCSILKLCFSLKINMMHIFLENQNSVNWRNNCRLYCFTMILIWAIELSWIFTWLDIGVYIHQCLLYFIISWISWAKSRSLKDPAKSALQPGRKTEIVLNFLIVVRIVRIIRSREIGPSQLNNTLFKTIHYAQGRAI